MRLTIKIYERYRKFQREYSIFMEIYSNIVIVNIYSSNYENLFDKEGAYVFKYIYQE